MPTSTHTRTHTRTVPADPYLACSACGARVEWWDDVPGPLVNQPCGHRGGYEATCPSWGPVHGCRCMEFLDAPEVCRVPPSAELLEGGHRP